MQAVEQELVCSLQALNSQTDQKLLSSSRHFLLWLMIYIVMWTGCRSLEAVALVMYRKDKVIKRVGEDFQPLGGYYHSEWLETPHKFVTKTHQRYAFPLYKAAGKTIIALLGQATKVKTTLRLDKSSKTFNKWRMAMERLWGKIEVGHKLRLARCFHATKHGLQCNKSLKYAVEIDSENRYIAKEREKIGPTGFLEAYQKNNERSRLIKELRLSK